ncbi:Nitrogen fixation protein of unknown function [Synechococcus sp. MIT S9509]|uniref:Nif11-like leader peptide family natural product precursor n=1 Tax=unclassified Synechococcus TaxID=2626047 RepID=UPI0007BC65F1|nr:MULTISPECIES: Nif11-like leader peptide family natural product precursor [unclassified Synechococcus]KZR85654.1 Nitrogen fixation protein of unknown function [Synechococcus sp. MIT S9504]KZR93622.1 Nitrogen fixation protein of unknown function [Synechococcus sp. MIT S9509]
MSEEQLKAFLEKVKADTSLQEKLKAAADVDAVLAIAKEAGFMISAEDLKNAQVTELSDEELEGAAGGDSGGDYLSYAGCDTGRCGACSWGCPG